MLKRTGVADVGAEPGYVRFGCDPARGRVTLGEVGVAFGLWVSGVQPPTAAPIWAVSFPTAFRLPAPTPAGAGIVEVDAEVAVRAGQPPPADARVGRLTLVRSRAGPE